MTLLGRRLTLKGVKPIAPFQWPREALWLYGLVSPQTGQSFFYEYSHLDSLCFEHYLQIFSDTFPAHIHVIQLDGAGAHIAQGMEIPDNIILLFQPPHSPELNPIERFWLDLKLDLRGENFASLDQLRIAIREVLSYCTPESIMSLIQYPYIMDALSAASIT